VLDYIDKHKIGILTTIMFHLLVITMFLVVKLQNQEKPVETRIVLDFADPKELQKEVEEMKKEAKTQTEHEFIKSLEQQYLGHNIVKNEDQDPKQAIDKMVKDAKDELGIKDADQAERDKDASKPKIEQVEKKDVKVVPQKPEYTTRSNGERVFERGNVTTAYLLKGRMHIHMPSPAYKCYGSGKVVLEILVNRNGYVLSAQINRTESQITEQCLIDEAVQTALISRFNEKADAPEKQSGRITYIFIAQ
jgi:outer membrane biosynthesis protein TonB